MHFCFWNSFTSYLTHVSGLKTGKWLPLTLPTSSESLAVRLSQRKVTSIEIQSQRLARAKGQEEDTETGKGQMWLLKRLLFFCPFNIEALKETENKRNASQKRLHVSAR